MKAANRLEGLAEYFAMTPERRPYSQLLRNVAALVRACEGLNWDYLTVVDIHGLETALAKLQEGE